MNEDTEVYQRLSEIENMLGMAARSCHLVPEAPRELAVCLERLTDCAHRAKQAHLLHSGCDAVIECLGELEATGHRACHLCAEHDGRAWVMAATLDDVYGEIRDLKRQLETPAPR